MTDYSTHTDGASAAVVLATAQNCANSWDGNARLLGNVRARDISAACAEAIHALSVMDRYNSMETALVAIRLICKEGPRNTASWHDVDDIAAAALSIAASSVSNGDGK